MTHDRLLSTRRPLLALVMIVCLICTALPVASQDTVTGAFEGTVTNSDTGDPVASATALIINQQTGQTYPKTSDTRGRFGAAPRPFAQSSSEMAVASSRAAAASSSDSGDGSRWKSGRVPSGAEHRTT